MTSSVNNPQHWLRKNWFIPVAACVIAGDMSALHYGNWSGYQIVEAALLFDFVVLIPLLYWWCYRAAGKATIVQAIALGCFAIWATGKAIPAEHHQLLDSIGWLRYVGLAGLIALEVKLLMVVYKAVILSGQSRTDTQKKLESEGMPPWAAKLMALEAALWRKGWLLIKRVFGHK